MWLPTAVSVSHMAKRKRRSRRNSQGAVCVPIRELRDDISELRRTSEIQFKRIAQIQADLGEIRRAWNRAKIG